MGIEATAFAQFHFALLLLCFIFFAQPTYLFIKDMSFSVYAVGVALLRRYY